jgi:hypothetical protein
MAEGEDPPERLKSGRLHQRSAAHPHWTAPMPSTNRPITAKRTYTNTAPISTRLAFPNVRPPKVKFYRAPTSVRCGYVDLKMPDVVFVRAGMDPSETRPTIAHEIAHLAEPTSMRHAATRQPGDGVRGGRRRPASRPSPPPRSGRSTPLGCGLVVAGDRVAGARAGGTRREVSARLVSPGSSPRAFPGPMSAGTPRGVGTR